MSGRSGTTTPPGGDLADVSVVVVSWNTRDLLDRCLTSLRPARRAGAQVVVVDNASHDGSASRVADAHPDVELVRNRTNLLFAAACNQGAALARGEYLLLLNPDTELRPGALERLRAFLATHPAYGAVAPRLVDPDGRTQRADHALPGWWTPLCFGTPLERWWPASPELRRYQRRADDPERDGDVPQPPAACLLLRRATWEALGGFDEELPLFFNDVDLSRRLAARGLPTRHLAAAEVVHRTGSSTSQLDDFAAHWHRDRLTYFRKHHGPAAGAWVKACTGWAWADHLLSGARRRLRGQPAEPALPLCRAFARFLVS